MKYPDDFINKIICGDCLEVMKGIPDGSIDLTVTSPPYDNLRDYGNDWVFDFEGIAEELFRVTKEGRVVVWVVGDATIDGSETGSSFRQALKFIDIGFNLHDTMIYQKADFSNPSNTRYHQIFEYMFIFSKGKLKIFNPIKDIRVKWGLPLGKNTTRGKNGVMKVLKKATSFSLMGMRTNIWRMNTTGQENMCQPISHPATFPKILASDHIKSWSNENDVVLDPMCGSATTAKMARKLGRNYISIEINPDYCKIAEQRLAQTELFTPEPQIEEKQSEMF